MIYLLLIIIFFLGASAASFAGVLLERGRKENSWRKRFRSVATTRSICVGCERVLARWQLIPILGRAFQKGHCLHCKKQIPARYSWFEVVMGVVFVLIFWFGTWGFAPEVVMSGAGIFRPILLQWVMAWAILSLLIADVLWYEVDLFFVAVLLSAGLWFHALPGSVPAWWVQGALWWGGCFGMFRVISYFVSFARYGKWQAGIGGGDVVLAVVLWMITTAPARTHWIQTVQYLSVYMILASCVTLLFWLFHMQSASKSPAYLPFVPGMLIAWVVMPYVRAWYMGW